MQSALRSCTKQNIQADSILLDFRGIKTKQKVLVDSVKSRGIKANKQKVVANSMLICAVKTKQKVLIDSIFVLGSLLYVPGARDSKVFFSFFPRRSVFQRKWNRNKETS